MPPDFIGIGAQKAGTTWLDRNLRLHPQIWMPPLKELHYFNGTFDRRRKQLKNRFKRQKEQLSWEELLWDTRFFLGSGGLYYPPSYRGYASLFTPKKGQIAGEITPEYSILEADVISRIYSYMPKAKIVFMIRNPIERAWSQTVMHFRGAKKRPLAAEEEEGLRQYFKRRGTQRRTNYLRTLKTWRQFYPAEQIFVGFLEDIHFHPGQLLESVYGFLGVDQHFNSQAMKQKVHSRSTGKIPTKLAIDLASLYHSKLKVLDTRFGGYASFWLYCAERLIENPPTEETIPYPLWESSLWEDWLEACGQAPPMGSREAEPQSGPLSSIRTTT